MSALIRAGLTGLSRGPVLLDVVSPTEPADQDDPGTLHIPIDGERLRGLDRRIDPPNRTSGPNLQNQTPSVE